MSRLRRATFLILFSLFLVNVVGFSVVLWPYDKPANILPTEIIVGQSESPHEIEVNQNDISSQVAATEAPIAVANTSIESQITQNLTVQNPQVGIVSKPNLSPHNSKISPEVASLIASEGSAKVVINLANPNYAGGLSLEEQERQISVIRQSVLDVLRLDESQVEESFSHISAIEATITAEDLVALESANLITYVQIDFRSQAQIAELLDFLGFDQSYAEGYNGTGINIAVLDTGIDRSESSLQTVVTHQVCVLDEACNNRQPRSEVGHGTGIAAIIHSLAPMANLYDIQVLDSEGAGLYSDWLHGLNYLIANQESLNVHVVNMSLGTSALFAGQCESEFPAAVTALNQLKQMGVTVFASTGNQGMSTVIAAPSCLESVIAVGSSYDANLSETVDYSNLSGAFADCKDLAGTVADTPTCFSNSNGMVDILSPGALISLQLDDASPVLAGTSQAAAVASATAALMLDANPYLQPRNIRLIMQDTGVDILDTRNNLSFSRINAYEAVLAAANTNFNCADVETVPQSECAALSTLYSALSGSSSSLEGWLDLPNPCDWEGVLCSSDRITGLILSQENLKGSLPNIFNQLPNLVELRLDGNDIDGSVPVSITSLENLAVLDIGYNRLFSNSIPVRDFLAKADSDWEYSQTVPAMNVNVVALAPEKLNIFWSPIFFDQGLGGYEVFCSNSATGPFTSVGFVEGKDSASLEIAVAANASYYCQVQTISEPSENNPLQLVSIYSAVDDAATTPEGLQDQVVTFFPYYDTTVSTNEPNADYSGARGLISGSYFDGTNGGNNFDNARTLMAFDLSGLPTTGVVDLRMIVYHYGSSTGEITQPFFITLATTALGSRSFNGYSPDTDGENYTVINGQNVQFPDYEANGPLGERPVFRTILFNPERAEEFLTKLKNQSQYFGLVIRTVNESDPGVAICSINLDLFCGSADVGMQPRLEIVLAQTPPPAFNPSPDDDSKHQPLAPVFTWETLSDPQGDTQSYNVYAGDSAENLQLVASNLSTPNYSDSSFNYGAHVFWRVDIVDSDNNVTTGNIWDFYANFCDPAGQLDVTDCESLASFYFNMDRGDTSIDDWLTMPPCSAFGVTCQANHVSSLDLSAAQLTGDNLEMLAWLSQIQSLNLSDNEIAAAFPEAFGLLSNLQSLNLANNRLYSTIPTSIGEMQSLQVLNLSGNTLYGTVPAQLTSLNLSYLNLTDNFLNGNPFDFVTSITELEELYLGQNLFDGQISTDIDNLMALRRLDLSYNAFSGPLPAELASLSQVNQLDLSHNMLEPSLLNPDLLTAYLQTRQADWFDSQTVAPTNLHFGQIGDNNMQLLWTGRANQDTTGAWAVICATELREDYLLEVQFTTDKSVTNYDYTGLFPLQRYYCSVAAYTSAGGLQKNELYSRFASPIDAQTTFTATMGTSPDNAIIVDKVPYNYVIDFGQYPVNSDGTISCESGGGGRTYVKPILGGGGDITRIKTEGTNTNTALIILVRQPDGSLVPVACNNSTDDSSGAGSTDGTVSASSDALIDFQFQEGVEYYIVVVNEGSRDSQVTLTLESVNFAGCTAANLSGVSSAECQALVDFYTSTAEDALGWRNSTGWLTSSNVCEWFGTVCRDSHLVGLLLPNNRVSGRFPASFSNLIYLENVNLLHNELRGDFPIGLPMLSALQTFNVSYNLLYSGNASVSEFLLAKSSYWRMTQTVAPSILSLTPLSSTSLLLELEPIQYLGDGYYQISYGRVSGELEEVVRVSGDKTTSRLIISNLIPNTTYYIFSETISQQTIFEPRSITSDRGAERVYVSPPNPAPIAVDDVLITSMNRNNHLIVLDNDSDPEGEAIHILSFENGSNGRVTDNGRGDLSYQPNSQFYGVDTFTYVIVDEVGNTNSATVTVHVEQRHPEPSTNTAPVASPDSQTTAQGVPVTIAVLLNDTDLENDSLQVLEVTAPQQGYIELNELDEVIYTPYADFVGTDQFTYLISDGSLTSQAIVTVTVNRTELPNPQNRTPIALDDFINASGNANINYDVLANDYDPEGGELEIIQVSTPLHGRAVIHGNGLIGYQPDKDFAGQDEFTYLIQDETGATAIGRVTVTVSNQNPAQVDDAGLGEAQVEATENPE